MNIIKFGGGVYMPIAIKDVSEKLTAIIEPSEVVYVASCPELDLATGIVKKILKT